MLALDEVVNLVDFYFRWVALLTHHCFVAWLDPLLQDIIFCLVVDGSPVLRIRSNRTRGHFLGLERTHVYSFEIKLSRYI